MAQVIYGIHPVKEALRSPRVQFEKILVGTSSPHPSFQSLIDLATQRHVSVSLVSREELAKLARGGTHQNVVALVKEASYITLESLLSEWKKGGGQALFLILDSIQDPQNFGSLIRTASGCGVEGIIIPKDRAVGMTPVVIKASAGAAAHLPVARVVNLAMTIDTLKKEGIWVYGASGEGNEVIYDLDFSLDLAIVLGAEGAGIRPLLKKKCDRLFSIPMKGPVSSFNVSVSGGMILYEVMRQRHQGGKKDP
jgi:23S rRNA (guanosine2251-2'-O)-methyltransferase